MRVGIGLGVGFLFGAGVGGVGAINTAVPTIDSINYPGGAYTVNSGSWTGQTSLALMIQSSADGISGWTDEASYSVTGDWLAANELDYMRVRITAQPGNVVAYSAVLQLGIAYDYVVDFLGNANWLEHTVSTPFIGADLAAATTGASDPGFWLMAEWYYDGAAFEGSHIMSLGNTGAVTYGSLSTIGCGGWREASGPNSFAENAAAIGGAGWYLTTCRMWNTGANHTCEAWVGETAIPGFLAGNNLSLTNFTTLRIGDVTNSAPVAGTNFDERISWVAAGRGNPVDAHAWAYNEGRLRRIDGYDFAADTKATIELFCPLYRKGTATFVAGDVVDSLGSFDSWSYTGTGITWANDLPGFIDPSAPPPATPSRYIYPEFADLDDATFTLCINTKKIGEAIAGDFTVTSLTHSVAGNIAGTVTGTTFPNPGVGVISYTISGVSGTCEVLAKSDLPAYLPNFSTRYGGNARAAGILNYPAPGAGTTYANIAAMKVAIDALGAGATLIIDDLVEAGTLTLTAKSYGGATLVCENRHGVAINAIVMDGVSNLTLRGFSCLADGISGGTLAGSVTLDHCTGRFYYLKGATANVTVSNWIGPDDDTAEQCTVTANRYTLRRVAHANTPGASSDNHRTDGCNIIDADRFYFGDNGGTSPGGHYDLWQTFSSGSNGFTKGFIRNGVLIDENKPGETTLSGALFLTGIEAQGLRVKRIAIRGSNNPINIDAARQNCSIENTTSTGASIIGSGALANSSLASNNVREGAGTIMSASVGVETGTLSNVVMATAYPQWGSHAWTWEQWANPAGGYTTAGAFALIAELAANKAAYP